MIGSRATLRSRVSGCLRAFHESLLGLAGLSRYRCGRLYEASEISRWAQLQSNGPTRPGTQRADAAAFRRGA